MIGVMWRFILRTLALTFAFMAAIGATIYVGHQQPIPERGDNLHLQACNQPCWIGIVPGQTSVDEAFARIDAKYATTLTQSLRNTARVGSALIGLPNQANPQVTISIFFSISNNRMDGVHMGFYGVDDKSREYRPTVGEIVTIWGKPSCVGRIGDADRALIYVSPDGLSYVTMKEDAPFEWTMPMYTIGTRKFGLYPHDGCDNSVPWSGLAIARYLRHP